MTLGTLSQYPVARRPARREFDRLLDDLTAGFGLAPLSLATLRVRPGACRGTLRAVPRGFSPPLEARELEEIATESGRSIASLVRETMAAYLKRRGKA